MCSITGIIDFQSPAVHNAEILNRMNQAAMHRGPDSAGLWCAGHAALGHRRLSVIDLAGGHQPMSATYRGRTAVIVYNGELYNSDQLRRELSARGNIPATSSDTELLLRSYLEWDEGCLGHFNGIFAFAIYDYAKKELFAARDHFGVKPFFYAVRNGAFLFASEIKSLLRHPGIEPVIDQAGLCELFGLMPARTPGCGVFSGIHELKGAHMLRYTVDGLEIKPYWELKARPHTESPGDTVAHVRELVRDSIKRQLVSDVPLGTFLSGGLDSSIISAVAARDYKERGLQLDTFSVDYVDNDRNFVPGRYQPDADAPWIDIVSSRIGSRHHKIYLTHDQLAESLGEALFARDLPGMADVDSSLLLFCREVKKHVVVAVSGECADELFAGYPWYHDPAAAHAGQFPWSPDMDFRSSFLSEALRKKLPLADYAGARYSDTVNSTPVLDTDDEHTLFQRRMFKLNLDWFMANLLDRKDRMSMASGLEVRVPYCDFRLVEYAYNMPWSIKTLGGREKGVLRAAALDLLPEEVVMRKKSPYPKTFDPRYTKAVLDLMQDVLSNPNEPLLDLVDQSALKRLCSASPASRPWFGQLMSGPQLAAFMWQVNQWLKDYKVIIRI